MIATARLISWLALAGTITPSILFFNGQLSLVQAQLWMLIASIAWFATAPLWMDRRG